MKKMSRVRFHGREAIGKITGLTWWGPNFDGWDNNKSVKDNLELLEDKPDMIVTFKPLDMIGMKDVDIPICLRYNEAYDWNWTTREIDESGAEFVIFHHENDEHIPMSRYQEHYGKKIKFVHIPHCAEKEVFKDWGNEKEYDIMMAGAVDTQTILGPHYPLRRRFSSILDKMRDLGYKVYTHPHPGYDHNDAYTSKYLVEFSQAINKAKICLTCSGAPKSRFGKYIEIPASGPAVAGDLPNQDHDEFKKFLIELDLNMTDDEMITKLRSYLDDETQLHAVIQNGLKFAEKYTQEWYAKRFVEEANEYLNDIITFPKFSKRVDYNYKKDLDDIKTIAYYTKTRINPELVCDLDNFQPQNGCGLEQTFFIKSVLESVGAKRFFEIGTGRGTAAYAASLIPSIEEVVTVDIVPHDLKRHYAIGYKQNHVSNKDLYDMIPFEEKKKISFRNRDNSYMEYNDYFDVCFIDGNHSDYDVIREDFEICHQLIKDNGFIIWDDYTDRFMVKKVVDDILKEFPQYSMEFIQTRNTIFDNEKDVDDYLGLMRIVK